MGGFVRFIKKQHFWLIIPVLFIVMAAAWFLAAGEQKKKFKTRVDSINGQFSTVQGISGSGEPHPNEAYHKGMAEKIKARAADVAAAWEAQYSKQVNVMKWNQDLGGDFLDLVDTLRPIEGISEEFTLPDWVLQNYHNFIVEKELKRLAESIGSVWAASEAAAGGAYGSGYGGGGGEGGDAGDGGGGYSSGYGGGAGGGYGSGYGGGGGESGAYFDDEEGGLTVFWSQESQSKILGSSFPWLATAATQPTVTQMLYAQEDVWVLDSLMQIIKATNGDANDNSQAIIKEIMSIDLAGACKPFDGEISAVQSKDVEEDDSMYGDEGMGGGYDSGYGAGGGGYGEMDGEMMVIDPLEGRYVDANYAAIDAETMRSNATSEDLEQVEVAKRMPVRIRVKMDTRRFGKFLASCANAPLTFEVHQIRVNPSAGGAGAMGGMMGGYGAMGGGGDAAGGYGAPPGGGGGYSSGYGGGAGGEGGYGGSYGGLDGEDGPVEGFDKTVEFFGIIYIYNPVDKAKLKTGESDEAGGDDGEAAEGEEATVASVDDDQVARG